MLETLDDGRLTSGLHGIHVTVIFAKVEEEAGIAITALDEAVRVLEAKENLT